MENHTCEEVLDCLYLVYKVSEIVRLPDRLPSLNLLRSLKKRVEHMMDWKAV